MKIKDVISNIEDALVYCHVHSCCTCKKRDMCATLFGFDILESKILSLAIDCKMINDFEK